MVLGVEERLIGVLLQVSLASLEAVVNGMYWCPYPYVRLLIST
jgi:hypothetical protein